MPKDDLELKKTKIKGDSQVKLIFFLVLLFLL